MIIGIGVDIVETARVEKLLNRFGERFARRVLTADELQAFEQRQQAAGFLALRFAAKEAVAKAFGTGIGEQFGFHSMQIENNAAGKPEIKFLEPAAALISSHGLEKAFISLSDEKHYVVAMAVLES